MDKKKAFALAITFIIIIAALAYLFRGEEDKPKYEPTIEHMSIKDVPKLLFTNSEEVISSVQSQVDNVEVFEKNNDILLDFKGFDGTISVGSYEEALWVAPLANLENKMITVGKSTYKYQEDVWGEMAGKSRRLSYRYFLYNGYDLQGQ
jgi:hypothetical protein